MAVGVLGVHIGNLGRNTLLTSSALLLRAGLQAAYLLVLSRWLGAEGYGLFASSVAAAVLLAPLAGLGMGYVFTEQAAQPKAQHALLWRAAVRHSVGSGTLFALASVFAVQALMPVRLPLTDMALVALAELLAMPIAQLSTTALLALDRGGMAGMAAALVPALRLGGALLLVTHVTDGSVHLLVLSHCAASVFGAVVLIVLIDRATRRLKARNDEGRSVPGWRAMSRNGATYAAGAFTGNAYFEIDKVLILQLLGASVAGTYSAAFRVVAVFTLPLMALLASALPRLFALEQTGTATKLLRQVVAGALGYSVVGVLVLVAGAPLIPWLFGAGFEESAQYVKLLAAWVPLYALHACGANALVAAGGKLWRLAAEGAGLALVVVLCLALMPRMGAVGAVTSLLAGEVWMALACWLLLPVARRARS